MIYKQIQLAGGGICHDCLATLNYSACYQIGKKLRTDGGCATNVICTRCYRRRLREELARLDAATPGAAR